MSSLKRGNRGGRRSGKDRRKYLDPHYSGTERRRGLERRSGIDRRRGIHHSGQ